MGKRVDEPGSAQDVVLVVDVANVMGSRPDGWWLNKAAAAARLLAELAPLRGTVVSLADEAGKARVVDIRAVLEGATRRVDGPAAVSVVRAPRDGDSTIVEESNHLVAVGRNPLVVTADRALRRRLPQQALVAGPGWLNALLGRGRIS